MDNDNDMRNKFQKKKKKKEVRPWFPHCPEPLCEDQARTTLAYPAALLLLRDSTLYTGNGPRKLQENNYEKATYLRKSAEYSKRLNSASSGTKRTGTELISHQSDAN